MMIVNIKRIFYKILNSISTLQSLISPGTGSGSIKLDSNCEASGNHAKAMGYGTKASSWAQNVRGTWNVEDPDVNGIGKYADIVGNGGSDGGRHNAYALTWQGDARYSLGSSEALYTAMNNLGIRTDCTIDNMLSLKTLLTKILNEISSLKAATTISEAEGTRGTAASVAAAEVAQCRFVKQGKRVLCFMTICRWDGSTALGQNTTLFTIPTGYRPTGNILRRGYCMRYNNGSRLTQSCNILVNSNGTIQQGAASDVVSVFLTAEWQTS